MELAIQMEVRPAPGAAEPEEIGAPEGTSEAALAVPESVLLEPGSASDGDLVIACIAGHPHYFGVLVQRYTGMVISFARSRLKSADLAEEAAQETMVRAYEQLLHLKVPRSFSNWLVGIANHVVIRMHNERRGSVPLAQMTPGDGGIAPPETEAEDERWPLIVDEVNLLPLRYRIVLVLKHLQGLSCREICDRLQLPIGTVTGRLSRGYAMLREKLRDRRGGGEKGD